MDASLLTVLVLFAAVILRVVLILGVVWLLIPRRATCPHCRQATFGLQGPKLLLRMKMQRRWCPCGWEGLSKSVPAQQKRRVLTGERFRRTVQP